MSSKVKDKQVRGNNVGRTFQMQEKAHVKGPEAERRLPYLENSNKGWCGWNLVVIQERTECGGAGETGKCQKKKKLYRLCRGSNQAYSKAPGLHLVMEHHVTHATTLSSKEFP